jgi:hypothetical protein
MDHEALGDSGTVQGVEDRATNSTISNGLLGDTIVLVQVILTEDVVSAFDLDHTVRVDDTTIEGEPTEPKDRGIPTVLHEPVLKLTIDDEGVAQGETVSNP